MYSFLVLFILMAFWIVFSGLLDAFHLTLGLVSAVTVLLASGKQLFDDRETGLGVRVGQASRLTAYLLWLLWEILLANFHVLRLALHPRGPRELAPSMLRVRMRLRSDFERWLYANSITLTPGTVTVQIDGDDLLVHAISRHTAKGLDGQMEARIWRIFHPVEGMPA